MSTNVRINFHIITIQEIYIDNTHSLIISSLTYSVTLNFQQAFYFILFLTSTKKYRKFISNITAL